MKLCIISNPVSGNRNRSRFIGAALDELSRNGTLFYLRTTRKRGDAYLFARQEAEKGTEVIAVSGGDGTINEVANALIASDARMGVIPCGTANLLALELGIPIDPVSAVDVILRGTPRLISLGQVTCRDADGSEGCRSYFVLMVGAGLDAGVLREVKRTAIARWGKVAYIATALRVLPRYTRTELSIQSDRGDTIRGYGAVISNARYYGGKFALAPDASLADGNLDLYVFKKSGPLPMIRAAIKVITGSAFSTSETYYAKVKTVTIRSADDLYLQADGDFLGIVPASITVKEKALWVIGPKGSHQATGRSGTISCQEKGGNHATKRLHYQR